jgi:hypothetical protein
VVVVVTGPGVAGCVVCDDVVVVLPDGVDPQADKSAMAAVIRLGRMNFFMVISIFGFLLCPAIIPQPGARRLWGVARSTRPALAESLHGGLARIARKGASTPEPSQPVTFSGRLR